MAYNCKEHNDVKGRISNGTTPLNVIGIKLINKKSEPLAAMNVST